MLRGALFSVGGTPAPIIEALKRDPVECALFVVSDKSEQQVCDSILPAHRVFLAMGVRPSERCRRLEHVLPTDPQCSPGLDRASRPPKRRHLLRSHGRHEADERRPYSGGSGANSPDTITSPATGRKMALAR